MLDNRELGQHRAALVALDGCVWDGCTAVSLRGDRAPVSLRGDRATVSLRGDRAPVRLRADWAPVRLRGGRE